MGRRNRTLDTESDTYFVTTTVVRFLPIFRSFRYCDILIRNIRYYQRKYDFRILGYVIMPSHFHWIVRIDRLHGTLSDLMRDLKKYSAWDLLDALERDRRRDLLREFDASAIGRSDQRRKVWMSRFDDQVIRSPEMFHTKLTYIHENPVKARIVAHPVEYCYSSARNYLLNDHSVLVVDVDGVTGLESVSSRNGP